MSGSKAALGVLCFPMSLAHAAVTAPLCILPLMLAFGGETAGGRLAGIAALAFLLFLLTLWPVVLLKSWKSLRIVSAFLGIGAVACLAACCLVSPDGDPPAGNLSQHFSGKARFRRWTASNLVPEIDQLKLGSFLFTFLDPYINVAQGRRVRSLFLDLYREMRTEPAFCDVGSALGTCYQDIFLGRRRTLHFYQYVPHQLGRDSYPVLIFLHGSLGNFKGYMWVLKELADSAGIAVVAPTYGCGNWRRDRGDTVLPAVLEHCRLDPALDAETLVLAGLSNGGTGVTREIQRRGDRYAGFVLISPVVESAIVSSDAFAENAGGKPFLMITGEKDRRIPFRIVRACAEMLVDQGVTVTPCYHPEEDHFLFFAQRRDVVHDIEAWLATVLGATEAGMDH